MGVAVFEMAGAEAVVPPVPRALIVIVALPSALVPVALGRNSTEIGIFTDDDESVIIGKSVSLLPAGAMV